jgi:circadian clock protein KaiC
MTEHGIELKDVYVGGDGVLTGSMRVAHEQEEQAASISRQKEIERRKRQLERNRKVLDAQLAVHRAQFEAEQDELELLISQELGEAERASQNRRQIARNREAQQPVARAKRITKPSVKEGANESGL